MTKSADDMDAAWAAANATTEDASLEARAAALEAERARLREALTELRSCSRAKIGMEDDFACADAQMHAILHPTSEAPHA